MDKLKAWKNKEDRKPMVLMGARQVGKTWLMKEFGMNIPWWRSHPIHEKRATESIWTEPCNPLLRATKSTKRATSA